MKRGSRQGLPPVLPSLPKQTCIHAVRDLSGRAGAAGSLALSTVTLPLLLSMCDPVPRCCPQVLSFLASMAPAPSATSRRGST